MPDGTILNSSLQDWAISEEETAIEPEPVYSADAGTHRLYIPKLQPLIPMGIPKVTPAGLNPNIFINASDCKVTGGTTINTQNYVTVKKYDSAHFMYPLLKQGMTLKVNFLRGDIDEPYLTNNLDPSVGDRVYPFKEGSTTLSR